MADEVLECSIGGLMAELDYFIYPPRWLLFNKSLLMPVP
jgi:hypothetical protein